MHAKDIKMKVLFQWSKSDHFISEYFSGWLKEKDFQLVAKTVLQWWPQPLHWTGGSYSPPAASSSTSTVWGRRTGRGGGSLCCDLSTKQRTATSRWLVPEPPSLSQIVIEKAVFNLNSEQYKNSESSHFNNNLLLKLLLGSILLLHLRIFYNKVSSYKLTIVVKLRLWWLQYKAPGPSLLPKVVRRL